MMEALVEHGRLVDVAAGTGLPKATVHRILRVMVVRGLASPLAMASSRLSVYGVRWGSR